MDNSTGITKKYSSPAGPATKVGLAKAKSELGASQAHENMFLNLRSRFIQRLMKHGKKAVAVKLFDESLEIFYQKVQNLDSEELNRKTKRKKSSIEWNHIQKLTKMEIFMMAFLRAKPWFGTSSVRRGGKKILIPEILSSKQQESIAIRWLVLNSRTRSSTSTCENLAKEFLGCLTDQGKTMNQRAQIHQLAESNRASIGVG
jgi:small subunit ribosomal protein S7